MVPLSYIVRVEPIKEPVRAHTTKHGVHIPAHSRRGYAVKVWFWSTRGYFTKVIRYKGTKHKRKLVLPA